MSRDLSAGVISAIEDSQVRPFYLFQGEFVSGTVRAWNGIGNLSWNSQTWGGLGSFLSFSSIEETSDVKAAGMTVSLNGMLSANISLALSDCRQGYSGKIYLGFFDTSNAIISSPYLIFSGRLDTVSIDEGPDTSTVTLNYESRLIDLQRTREIRYTDQEQQRMFSGDLGLEFVADLQDKTLTWGRR